MAKENSAPLRKQFYCGTCGERRIKVNRIFYEYRSRNDAADYVFRPIPWIQLKGKWLVRAGFTIDAKLRVRIMPGCLVLTVENE
jgi:hypothetical protein